MFYCIVRWSTSITAKVWSQYCTILKKIRRHLFSTCYWSFRQVILFWNGPKQDLASVAKKLWTCDKCMWAPLQTFESLSTSRQKFGGSFSISCQFLPRSRETLGTRMNFWCLVLHFCSLGVLHLHFKWSWADIICSIRILFCTIWVVRGMPIFPAS